MKYNSITSTATHSLLIAGQQVVPGSTVMFGGPAPASPDSQHTSGAASLLASMQAHRRDAANQPQVSAMPIDPLGFFNGLHLLPDHEKMLRDYTLDSSKDESTSEPFARAPYVDLSKVEVKLTDMSWALFRMFASDFAYHMVDERAYELATDLRFNRDGLRRLADTFYGALCGRNQAGDPVKAHLGDMWWRSARSADLRNISEVVMEPTSKPDDHTSRTFNRYYQLRRSAVRPDMTATRADIKLFDDQLLMSAGGCQVSREYALDWLAFLYQYPDCKPASGLALVSPIEGTGKSWFLYPLRWVFGEALVGSTGGDALYEVYDDPFIHKQIAFIDELPDPEKKRQGADPIAKINRMVTSRKTTMRPLGKAAVEMRTPAVIIACNKVDYLVAVLTGRRLCILYNPDMIRGADYYNALFAWAGVDAPGPGMAKLAGYLATRDVSKFNPHAAPPATAGKAISKAASLSREAKFFKALYDEEHPLFAKDFGRVFDLLKQIDTHFKPGETKGLSLNVHTLPTAFKELGWKQIGVDGSYQTADKASRAWCWRRWEKWGSDDTPRKDRIDHQAGGATLSVHEGGLSK